MATRARTIALVAALAIPAAAARAQPIVSPRQVDGPSTTRPSSRSASKPVATPAASRAAPANATKSANRRNGKTPAAPAKTGSRATSNKTKPARAGKGSRKAGTSRSGTSRGKTPQARLIASAKRGSRGDNMPRGFEWPPSAAMRAASMACEDELTALGAGWKHSVPEGHIAAPIELTDERIAGIKYTSKWRRPPYTLDCQLARALVEVGPQLYALGVREVRWGSIYRWSNVRTQGREFPFLSRHALGLAMDIVEFVDDTGRIANVEQDYKLDDPLLLAIEQAVNASGKFRIVLTPRNDPRSHHDHFHIEANPNYAAR